MSSPSLKTGCWSSIVNSETSHAVECSDKRNFQLNDEQMKRLTTITTAFGLMMLLVAPTTMANVSSYANEDFGGAYATFAGKFGGELNSKELRSTTELGIAGCAAGSAFTKFTLVINKEGKRTKLRGTSGKLTKEMVKGIRTLEKGDTFEFIDMQAKLPTGGKIDVMGKTFTIV